jgi:PPOX class probable F420-dependent enzyme
VASKRGEIEQSEQEIREFLEQHKTVVVGTNGPRGLPHLMPLWYVVRGGEIWAWTFTKSQKIKNLQRDPRATLLFEDGTTYEKLRGVSYECDVEVSDDYDVVRALGIEIFTRYGDGHPDESVVAMVEQQAQKRSSLRFLPKRTISWDHRKLGGVY